MREDTFHLLESLFLPECRDRLPVIMITLDELEKPDLPEERKRELLDRCLGLFEAQQADASEILGRKVELDIKEFISIITHNKRGLANRLKVFKLRTEES